jgi:uncharacterized protein (TIGR03066 family)
MNASRLLAVTFLALGMIAGTQGEERRIEGYKEKIIGLWEVVKADDDVVPIRSTMELTKTGEATAIRKEKGKEAITKSTYKVEGDKFFATDESGKEMPILKIKSLTAKYLTLEDAKGKVVEFKRKK